MKTLIALQLTILVLSTIYLHFGQCNASIIEQTCKSTPNYNLCVKTLNSDKRSATADVTGLALIMIDVIKAKATQTQGNIRAMLKSRPTMKKPLSSCADLYGMILDVSIPEAIEALTEGDPKFAEDGAHGCANLANNCEEEFKGGSPLTATNTYVSEISNITAAIIRLLL